MLRAIGRRQRRRAVVAVLCLGALAAVGSCVARPEGEFKKQTDDDAGGAGPIEIDGSAPSDAKGELPPLDPHAIQSVDPPHGPWSGGQLAMVHGNGFTTKVRVWFGAAEISGSDLVPVDAERVQVAVPAGLAGPVDVTVQNGDDASTRRTLLGGYVYDAFYAEPASGPTSGGTLVSIHGQATQWNAKTKAYIDFVACAAVEVESPTELVCTTPAGMPGSKPIRVVTEDGVAVDVLDAFTYGNSDNGFKGGLSGGPLGSELRVLTLDAYTGAVIPGVTAIAGDDLASALVQQTDGSGVTVFQAPGLGPKRSVTLAKKCYQPITFVDVPVDTVTAYLDPVLSPACVEEGDPPPVGGTPALGSAISGQLVWKSLKEFERMGWTNVPDPKTPDEKLVAYVLELSPEATDTFYLPSLSEAVTPESSGSIGYQYLISAGTGNLGLYALAGIENRVATPPWFKVYAMGVAKGVGASPGKLTNDVYIPVDIPLDHALEISLSGPTLTPKGPDRVRASFAVRVGELGYALLPVGTQEKLLPVAAPIAFVGVPALSGGLAESQYVTTASAVTGVNGGSPRSVSALLATNGSGLVVLDQFVEIPTLGVPSSNGTWTGTDLDWGFAPGGASVELSVISIQSAGGLSSWTVVAPTAVTATKLPDLAALGAELALYSGPLTIVVNLAHIDEFDYGSLRYRQLDTRGWNAYATDVFYAHW